ncbi:MAG: alpha/beta hydrolase [Bacillota bacterium]|nr:alpha/beta hydrolase [Bacillota bacterium]
MRGFTAWLLGLALLFVLAVCDRAGAQHAISVEYRQVEVSGLSLHYERYGPAEESVTPAAGTDAAPPAPPVLLLHGLGGSTQVWLKTAPELARAGFTVYALDFPGFGGSEVPPAKLSVLDLPRYAAAFLKELGVSRVSVVGNSMGGYVAWLLAADYPELVEKLVLVDAAGLPLPDPLPETLQRLRPWYLGLPGAGLIGESLERLLNSPELDDFTREIARPYIEQVFANPSRIAPEVFEALHRSFKESRAVFLGRLDFPSPAPDYARRLGSIAAPTLIIWGGQDSLLPPSHGGRFASLIPRSQLLVYPALGHVPMLEDAPTFLTDLLRFLRQ